MTKRRWFLDRLRIYVKGGTGGAGYPNVGGKGGDGGNVSFTARHRYNLSQLLKAYPTKRVAAHAGSPASRRLLIGRRGHDVNVLVPEGVELRLDDGSLLGELEKDGDRLVVARGGRGGGPMNGFAAERGQMHSVTVDLKLLADVGLVGFPNAGKSTLLGALSRATPRTADFPFTTLRPMVGNVEFADGRRISVADLPGLVEGAHRNVGLGHNFLKHVERCRCLLFVIDVGGFQFKAHSPWRSPEETALLLMRELERYRDEVAGKPALCVVNKSDAAAPDEVERVADALRSLHNEEWDAEVAPQRVTAFHEVLPIAARERVNTELLKQRLRFWLDELEAARTEEGPRKSKGKRKEEEAINSIV